MTTNVHFNAYPLHAEHKETVFEFDFPAFALSVTRLVLQRGVKRLPWGRGERVRFLTVSRSCRAGAVAKFDFKLCRSPKDGVKVRRKAESSSSEA